MLTISSRAQRLYELLVHAVHCWAYPDLHVRSCACGGSGRLPLERKVER